MNLSLHTDFKRACAIRDMRTVQRILNSIDTHDIFLALYIAIDEGCIEAVRMLLTRATGSMCSAALKRAVEVGHVDIVRLCLDHGADIHTDNEYALRWASFLGRCSVVAMLVERTSFTTTGYYQSIGNACGGGYVDIVKILLQACTVIEEQTMYNALRWAALKGHVLIIEALMQHVRKHGITNRGKVQYVLDLNHALIVATGRAQVLLCLIRNGADIHMDNDKLFARILGNPVGLYTLYELFDHGVYPNTIQSEHVYTVYMEWKEQRCMVRKALITFARNHFGIWPMMRHIYSYMYTQPFV